MTNSVDAEKDFVEEEEVVQEVKKASFQVDAEVPDPTNVTAKEPGGHAEKAESDPKKKKKQGSSDEHVASVPKNKADMVQKIADAIKGVRKEDLGDKFAKIMAAVGIEEYEELVESEEEPTNTVSISELKKITSEDIDISEDIKAVFSNDETLDEEFINRATVIFEAAVVAKVNSIIETITIDLESDQEAAANQLRSELSENLDTYLDYVVSEWMEANSLAVEQGIRAEIIENFMKGLHDLFTENYIDVPEEKTDLVDELVKKVEDLEESVNNEINKNIELKQKVSEYEKNFVIADIAEGLTDSDVEKLISLVEGIEFNNEDDFRQKCSIVKENYFPVNEYYDNVLTEVLDADQGIDIEDEDEVEAPSEVSSYVNAISRTMART